MTRAVAAGLRGEWVDNYQLAGWQRAGVRLLSSLPAAASHAIAGRLQVLGGQDPRLLDHFDLDHLVRSRLNDYAQLEGTFPALTVGVAQGGPSTILSLALGGPFLPQAYVVSLAGGASTGDVREYLERSLAAAIRIARANPSLLTIQHYDPIHDGWLTRHLNHLRFKLLELPELYAGFIRRHLQPGGAVVYLEGGALWLRYRLAERSVFQVGGWGGISPEEYLAGSQRIERYARRIGLARTDWRLSQYPVETGPESEWGSEPGLAEALEGFCLAEGYRFVRIRRAEPHGFSRLAFAAMRRLLEKEDREPAGTLVEMFSQFDATASFQAGLLPLWLVFNTTDALSFLQQMKPQFPPGKPVFFSPLSTFSLTPDLVPYDDWDRALPGFINIGAHRKRYPADLKALAEWATPLRAWVRAHPQPVRARLAAKELSEIAEGLGDALPP